MNTTARYISSRRFTMNNLSEDELRSLVRHSIQYCDAAERELRRRGTSSDWQPEAQRGLRFVPGGAR